MTVLESTPEQMLTWRPRSASGDPTSILDIAKHCIAAESMFQPLIRDGHMPTASAANADWLSSEAFATRGPAAEVHDKAGLVLLVADLERYAAEIAESLAPEAWDEIVETPFRTAPRGRFLWILASHWAYHCGQVAYIQRLYGDLSYG